MRATGGTTGRLRITLSVSPTLLVEIVVILIPTVTLANSNLNLHQILITDTHAVTHTDTQVVSTIYHSSH